MPDGHFSVVHKTEKIRNCANPSWEEIKIPLWNLCNGKPDQEIVVKCYDWDMITRDDLIGEAKFTLKEVVGPESKKSFALINKKREHKRKYENSGTLIFEKFEVEATPKPAPKPASGLKPLAEERPHDSFIGFLRSGLEVNFMVAIDFTSSNSGSNNPVSLHCVSPDAPENPYIRAIKSVGSILAHYDDDNLIPAYGYGADINGKTSHCFALNGDIDKPEVKGIDGVMMAYKKTLKRVSLSGPTFFSQVMEKAIEAAEKTKESNPYKYYIMLIITDGAIGDMVNTIRAIVRATDLPISFVIVGVGDGKEEYAKDSSSGFGSMERLDGDEKGLVDSAGERAKRDIVQFVEFNKYCENSNDLAHKTLEEIPGQMTEYMALAKIKPVKQANTHRFFFYA